jgi:hypothetical protein
MKPVEANRLAEELAGFFPSLTPVQVEGWALTFERYHESDVAAAIADHYRETMDGFVKPGNLTEAIRGHARRRVRPLERTESARKVDEQWEEIEAAIADVPDVELAALKERAIAELPEALRPWVVRKSPRESRTLKVCIARLLGIAAAFAGASHA